MKNSAILSLAMRSLWSRKVTAILTIISIAAAVLLFVAVENLRQGARTSFERTISDTDVIVGARSSPINLVLYSVFQICLLYTSPSPRDRQKSRMPSSA